MSLMFAKQFSEAGVTSTTTSKKGGRGRGGGSGFGSRGKRGGRGGAPPEDASEAGLFTMDASYRTHMLFPGRKDEDGGGEGPRRASGSPSFMKAMMSWGKRPSDPKSGAGNSQELTRYRATPTRASESEWSAETWRELPGQAGQESDPCNSRLVKSVSFHSQRAAQPPAPNYTPASPVSSLLAPSPPTNSLTNGFFSYHEPFRDHDYSSYVASGMQILCIYQPNTLIFCDLNSYV